MAKGMSDKELRKLSKVKFEPWTEEGVALIVDETSAEKWAKTAKDIAFLLRCATRIMLMDKGKIASNILKDMESSDALKTLATKLDANADYLRGLVEFMGSAQARILVAGAHAVCKHDKRAKKAA